jgi:hypothetical protein
MVHVRFVGADGAYQSIETQAIRIHKSLERWGGERVKSQLSLLPQDYFRRRGLFRRAPRREIEALLRGVSVLVVVKSSLFRGILEVAPLLASLCRERGIILCSNPCDGPGADSGDTTDVFSEQIADHVFTLSRLQHEALAKTRSPESVFFIGHASRIEGSPRVEPRDKVRKVIWENAVHHNPRYDPRKAGMPRAKYQELEDSIRSILAPQGASLVFIDAWRETQSYEDWERMMLDSDIAIECKALGGQYVDYQAQKPAVKVLNYMSVGLPVICDSLPAYRDLGADGKELLFADTLDAWKAQLSRLLEDRDLRARLGEASRAAAEPYKIENICHRYMEFFERITTR